MLLRQALDELQVSFPQVLLEPGILITDYAGKPADLELLEVELSSHAYCITDFEGRYVAYNDQYADLYGFSPEELQGQVFTMVVPVEYQAEIMRIYRAFFEGELHPPQYFSVQRKDGKLFQVRIIVYRVDSPVLGPMKITIQEE